jgi:inner membrane protein
LPSPIGHGLAGMAAGWLIDPPHRHDRRGAIQRASIFAAVAMAPDLDLLFGAHSGPTHGLGAAAIAGLVAWLCLREIGWRRGGTTACAIALAYASHTLLDWLGTDWSPPIGIMALWPFSRDYYESTLHVFMAISRRYWLPEFWTYNLRALLRELVILMPLVAAVVLFRRRVGRA